MIKLHVTSNYLNHWNGLSVKHPGVKFNNTYHAFLVSGIHRSTIAHQFTYDNVLSIETRNVKWCVTIQVWGIHLQSNKVNTWICIDQLQNVDKVVFFK